MATLHTGTSYELSQGSSGMNANKELIYVKLTDSALRAIEEYQRNPVSTQQISCHCLITQGKTCKNSRLFCVCMRGHTHTQKYVEQIESIFSILIRFFFHHHHETYSDDAGADE